MHILISGGTGFIGSHLCQHFLNQNHQVTVLTRNIHQNIALPIKLIDQIPVDEYYDVIINLAGESLFKKRWNDKFKTILKESRIQTTNKIINYIKSTAVKPKLLISGSAVGYYGNSPEKIFTENSSPENLDFAHELCRDWETTAMQAQQYGVRVCISRTGIVLGKNGGALKQMLFPAKFGLSAILGNGQQWISWIHIQDLMNALDFIIHHEELEGPINLTSPNPVNNKTLTNTLAKTLHRPRLLKFPPFLVKILFGEMGETLLLKGQKVFPEKLIQAGYEFKFPNLSEALKQIL